MGFLPISLPFLAQGPKPEKALPPPPIIGPTLKIPPLVINLKDERGRHFVKAKVILEVTQAQWTEEVNARIPLLTDLIILTLSDKRLADLRPPGAKENIKKDLVVLFNQSLKGNKIAQIYFDEFIFQ
jgi:flagellar basal body-associated protein FliL